MPTSTRDILDAYYVALKSGEPVRMRDVVTDDMEVVYHDAAQVLPWSGTWSGFDAFQNFLATVSAHLSIDSVEILTTHIDGDTAIVELDGRWTSKATGRHIAARVVNKFQVRDGRVCRYTVFPDTAAFAAGLAQPSC